MTRASSSSGLGSNGQRPSGKPVQPRHLLRRLQRLTSFEARLCSPFSFDGLPCWTVLC